MSKTYSISKGFHTKKEIDIWVLKLNRENRLIPENFLQLREKITQLDGYYSRYSKGFLFESQPSEATLTRIDEIIGELATQQQKITLEKILCQ